MYDTVSVHVLNNDWIVLTTNRIPTRSNPCLPQAKFDQISHLFNCYFLLNDNFKNIDFWHTGVLGNDVFTSIENILEFLRNIILYLKIGYILVICRYEKTSKKQQIKRC